MLNKLAKNQYVKLVKSNGNAKEVEYGVVLNEHGDEYDIISVGFENKDGHFLAYPPNVENLVQTYTTNEGTMFDEVKENQVRRAMHVWIEQNYKL